MRLARLFATALLLGPAVLHAAGPRWTAGSPFFSYTDGRPIVWFTSTPRYFTDPGDLSPSVNHAAADALVAAAAAAWNVSFSGLVLAQGGALDEHLSGASVFLGANGPVFPADVQVTNSLVKQIAIVYDTDGSVTETLLGGGAGDPANCRQNAVTESVDGIAPTAQITHALLILNGRCTGAAPELQLELKYKLIRAFGRVLGFGWSQANDNTFTASPLPTYRQALNWPLMHPIDVLCGPYAYQCVVQPFTLRNDDLASLASLYPVVIPGNGKTPTFDHATYLYGNLAFSNGQGMQGVNLVLSRWHQGPAYFDGYEAVSAVSGFAFQGFAGNPVTLKGTTLGVSFGSALADKEGAFSFPWIPIPAEDLWDNITVTTQPINPLYTGQYAVGPYRTTQVTPSGPALVGHQDGLRPTRYGVQPFVAAAGAGPCTASSDGTEAVPAAVDPSGFWSGTLCGYHHAAWLALPVRAGRGFTLEVTALDEQGLPTSGKLQPVLGAWETADPFGLLPTLAAQATSMNSTVLGMTALRVASATATRLRLAIGDLRGDGRPDFAYAARLLYADTVLPATLPANGGRITLSGMGFRPGNAVTVNGIAAQVVSITATSITAIAPTLSGPLTADIVVTDPATGGLATMIAALTYTQASQPDHLSLVSVPADGSIGGQTAAPNFSVRVLLPDGTTPAAGVPVAISATNATFGACSAASTCTLATDAHGLISTSVTPTAPGTATLHASVDAVSVQATFAVNPVPADHLQLLSLPSGVIYTSRPAPTPFAVQVLLPDGLTPAAATPVVVTAVNATLSACAGASSCTLAADAQGRIQTAVTPLLPGVVALLATAGGGSLSASFGAVALPADILRVISLPADGSIVGSPAPTPFGVQVLLGDGILPAALTPVTVTVSAGTLAACGSATCTLTTDLLGRLTTAVTPAAPGPITLNATAGGGTVSATFNAVAVTRIVTLARPVEYVAPGAAILWSPAATSTENGQPAASLPVSWTVDTPYITLSASTSVTSLTGTATIQAALSPILLGSTATGHACAWTTACATFSFQTVDPEEWRLVPVSGTGQSISLTDTFQPLIFRAVDSYSHPIAGVPVAIHQVANAWTVCPPTGHCPITPILDTSSTTQVTDADGLITVAPLDLVLTAEITQLVLAAGPHGFLSVTLVKTP